MISLRLFGGPSLMVNGQEFRLPTEQVRRVLSVLALAAPQLISRSALAGWLWPEMDQRRASHNLATTLFRLRKALPPAELLLDDGQSIGLNPRYWQLDINRVNHLQQQIEQHTHRSVDRCLRCLAAAQQLTELTGEPLLGRLRPIADEELDSWLKAERDRYQRLLTTAAGAAARAKLRAGETDSAQLLLQRALAGDPWHDELHLLLLQAIVGVAGPAAAWEYYRQHHRQLRRRFGLAPAAETRAFAESLSNRQITTPPPAVLRTHDTHDAAEVAEADAQLDDLIARPDTRVVTVIGATAVQRSGVIFAAGRRLAATFDGGTLWLAEAADADTLLGRLRLLLKLPADADLPALAAALNRRPPLVAVGRLGGCGAQHQLLADLSSACPQLVLLVGRDEPCLLWHETVYQLIGATY